MRDNTTTQLIEEELMPSRLCYRQISTSDLAYQGDTITHAQAHDNRKMSKAIIHEPKSKEDEDGHKKN